MNYFILNDDNYCEELQQVPNSASLYLNNIDCEQTASGDINGDSTVNIQDVILMINLILSGSFDFYADMNYDSTVDVLDVVQLVNLILN
mgnify:FL=1